MTPGALTTEHARAIRAEIACGVLACVGLVMCWRSVWFFGALLLALAIIALAAVSVFYGQQRARVKQADAKSQAEQRAAELAQPKQRVI